MPRGERGSSGPGVMILDLEDSPTVGADAPVQTQRALAYTMSFVVDGEPFLVTYKGYQCSTMLEKRYLATKAKLKELAKDNKDLLSKISDAMNKVFESEKLRSEAEENTKAITKRKEALEKELQEAKEKLEEKEAELKAFVVVDDEKIQAAYYQG
nr:hypothetical protein CFP56_66301 [Quercus suber]